MRSGYKKGHTIGFFGNGRTRRRRRIRRRRRRNKTHSRPECETLF
jgi:hypothetical protein